MRPALACVLLLLVAAASAAATRSVLSELLRAPESGESSGSGSGPRCGKQGGGKTCQQLGFGKDFCCSRWGYCSTEKYACNKDLQCQSGPCRAFPSESSEVSESAAAAAAEAAEASEASESSEESSEEASESGEETSAEEDASPIVKTISNAVPLCKACKKSEASEPAPTKRPPAPAPAQSFAPPPGMAAAGAGKQAQLSQSVQAAEVAAVQAIAKTEGAAAAAAAAPAIQEAVLRAELSSELSQPLPPETSAEAIRRIQTEGQVRAQAILDAAQQAARQIVETANRSGRGKVSNKRVIWIEQEPAKEKGGKLVVPLQDRKTETSNMKLPDL
jgi:hypothetical protein